MIRSDLPMPVTARSKRSNGVTFVNCGLGGTSRRPLAVAAMGARHVIGNCRVAAPVGRTGMARDPLTLVENLDRLVSDAHIDEFTDEAIRGGIPMAVDLDVIVGRNAATLPARKDVCGLAVLPA